MHQFGDTLVDRVVRVKQVIVLARIIVFIIRLSKVAIGIMSANCWYSPNMPGSLIGWRDRVRGHLPVMPHEPVRAQLLPDL